jgi:hypothetical protein
VNADHVNAPVEHSSVNSSLSNSEYPRPLFDENSEINTVFHLKQLDEFIRLENHLTDSQWTPLYKSSFIRGPVPMRSTSLLTDAWNNWGYDDGRSTRFPSALNGPCSDETVYVVLYKCETWSPTFREDHRVTVFEKRVLRRIFGPK